MSVALENHSLSTDGCFLALKEYLIAGTGLSYYCRRDSELADHISRHLKKLRIKDCSSYLQLLESGSEGAKELDNLIEDLTIGETFFFRHTDLFNALEHSILPAIIEKNKTRRSLRIWSAGSSIGAEAYTMSILLRRQLGHLIHGWEVTIIGTDINRAFLTRAAEAQYEKWALRGIDEEIKQQCFSCNGKTWTLNSEFKQGVSFQHHNLAMHPFPSVMHNLFDFDVILCRNVMIYFNQKVIASIVGKMRDCLVDGGWLLVGHAEHNAEIFRDYCMVPFSGATGYQRVDTRDMLRQSPQWQPTAHMALQKLTFASAPKPTTSIPKPQALPREAAVPQNETLASKLAAIRTLTNRGEIEHADVQCRELLKAHKLDPACHLYHALVLEQLNQHSASEQSLRRAIYLDRDCILAHYYLGLSLRRTARGAEAARSFLNARRLLGAWDRSRVVDESNGLTVGELDDLISLHLDTFDS